MTTTTGILFATSMEAESFLKHTRPDPCFVTVSGMGMEAANSATRQLIEEQHVTRVINAGICGGLDNSLVRGSVFFVSEVLTEDQSQKILLQNSPHAKRLVTVNTPVFETARKESLSAFADLVDMEGFAIARQCQAHNIPCVLIKGITDFGDSKGKADIRKHIAGVSEKVSEAILHYMSHHSYTGSIPIFLAT